MIEIRKVRRAADKRPTWTSLVFEALVRANDFASVPMLMAATRGTVNQVTAALSHLAKRHAVESVVGPDGKLWWFATPDYDDRIRVVEERVPEEPGNRRRGAKKVVVR